jgi:hypothetical protein
MKGESYIRSLDESEERRPSARSYQRAAEAMARTDAGMCLQCNRLADDDDGLCLWCRKGE